MLTKKKMAETIFFYQIQDLNVCSTQPKLEASRARSSPMFCYGNKFPTKHGNDILRRTVD